MDEAEAIYEGVKNATSEEAKKLGALAVLRSTGAIDSFAMIAKNYPEVLIALQAFEQMKFLENEKAVLDPSARDFAIFKKGQASVSKYMTGSLSYILSVDATKDK